MDNQDRLVVRYGNKPITTGAGTKEFLGVAYAMTVDEETEISHFYDAEGNAVVLGWEGVTLSEGFTLYFGAMIKSIAVASGGKGCYYLAEPL